LEEARSSPLSLWGGSKKEKKKKKKEKKDDGAPLIKESGIISSVGLLQKGFFAPPIYMPPFYIPVVQHFPKESLY